MGRGGVLLDDLLADAPEVRVRRRVGATTVRVEGVSHDSRAVRAGDLFCCLRGERVDGHLFAPAAVAAGAAALLAERPLDLAVAQVVVDDARGAMAQVAAAFHGRPSEAMTVVGVTGTTGKTTTTHLLAAIFDHAGMPCGVLGTLTSAHTTPEAPELQARLAAFRDDGKRAVAMEVSSHALEQHRADATRFAVAVFTNLGQDHLDFHGTTEHYFAAKARLFEPAMAAVGVANADDPYGRILLDRALIPMTGYSIADADDLVVGPLASTFRWRGQSIELPIGGRFNVSNALAAATAAVAAGVGVVDVAGGLAEVRPVPGRFEPVDAGQPFTVIVDFAHTPESLASVLAAAREVAGPGRVVVAFGCGGDRDPAKRPVMGEVAARAADIVVVTSDNPRREDPAAIIADVISGIPDPLLSRVRTEPDRRAAIAGALDAARPGDVVVIAGKGHETAQTLADRTVAFDDRVVARELLQRRRGVIALLIAAGVAATMSIFGTRFTIRYLSRIGRGQPILGREDLGPAHQHKEGTPTMGGIAILASAFVGYIVAHVRTVYFSDQAFVILGGVAALALVGFTDDFIKVRAKRNRGIFWKRKSHIMLGVSFLIALTLWLTVDINTTLSFTRADWPGIELPGFVYVLWCTAIIFATAHAVNVTDGLDGLAAGSALFGFFAFTIIAFWGFRNPQHLQHREPSRPGRAGRVVRGGVRRLPVVECRAGAHLHG